MEYNPKNVSIEIERLKSEISELKREEKSITDLNHILNSLQQKYERLKEEKKASEILLAANLQTTKNKIQEASYEKDRLEKDLYLYSGKLKNAKICIEEANEMLLEKQSQLLKVARDTTEFEGALRQKESELAKYIKIYDQAISEKKDLKTKLAKLEVDLQAQLKTDKELEDEEILLDLSESKIKTEIALLEREVTDIGLKEKALQSHLKACDLEQDNLEKFHKELEHQIIEITDENEKLNFKKEDNVFKIKQESLKNIKLESAFKQYQAVLNDTDQSFKILSSKLNSTEEKINQKFAEKTYSTAMLEEDKRDLERYIKASEERSDYLKEMQTLHQDLAHRIEKHSHNSKHLELKSELLKILE